MSTFGAANWNILFLKFVTCSVHPPPPIVTEDCKMAKYKPFDLVLASFQGYFLWPSVVIKTTKDQKNQARYLVFCYGTHSEHNIAEAHIRNWNDHFKEACARTDKDVNKAFDEQRLSPDIFQTLSKSYLSLSAKTKGKSSLAPLTPTSAAASTLKEIINETQEELMITKSNLMLRIYTQGWHPDFSKAGV